MAVSWRVYCVHRMRESVLLRCFSSQFALSQQNPNQTLSKLSHGHQQTDSKIYMKMQRNQNS